MTTRIKIGIVGSRSYTDKRKVKDLTIKSNLVFDKIFVNKKYQDLIYLKDVKNETSAEEPSAEDVLFETDDKGRKR